MQINIFPTLFVGQNRIHLKEVDSTSNFLKASLSNSEPLPEGTVIMAERQFAGRGQQESAWHAEPGKNLTASFYLRPSFLEPAQQFYLNMAISLAVAETVSACLSEAVEIKWPNDIYVQGRKLGGILIENTVSGNVLRSSVIGIGLNINQEEFPEPLQDRAVSLRNILHRDVDLVHLLNQLCSFIEKRYLQLRAGDKKGLHEAYEQKLFGRGSERLYRQNGEEFSARVLGVSEQGRLRMLANEQELDFGFKEITFLTTHS
ncbi:biotin--[acetyl-CoA-carboxylase] ligase [Pedobacter yulinensis]|uniref:Biotin--[acetyl-CoA-carboxylase] ligase n=1 Tax=Pedobacter yulinensis TaxID=2126353 RepID=A0A2T3HRH1_9SPHI|nr:biotin--[acetyl-CoA-carboxylase] ligase [Pedobacter yulinensis]PST85038.1 biotin--[acetyl-CoA-carboxylase] ligase [Pedobacter yulinensis]